MAQKIYKIFISHAFYYDDSHDRIVEMLNKAPDFSWMNYSVCVHDPLEEPEDELEYAIRKQISCVDLVIVLCEMYDTHKKWIRKEIDIASEMGKPIICIYPRYIKKVTDEVRDVAKDVVDWDTDSIVEAIRKYAL
ncbi:MAG: hypothetical protein B6D57_05040 [Candidatus Coatesbacteria bacterium 4484_99]|uniref:Thoeris protein ThsB TIR-like domain-containing protein n=1 Tax=Candidatus Coatesbacteria bacterium 4484_99 TaxID=1970774 RepID=A0A1W9RZQ7_9BACT|nr:MAG: hypothetical protein B6D57_05040 [Candidatus Coatesbacteria bacterium 4484_99]